MHEAKQRPTGSDQRPIHIPLEEAFFLCLEEASSPAAPGIPSCMGVAEDASSEVATVTWRHCQMMYAHVSEEAFPSVCERERRESLFQCNGCAYYPVFISTKHTHA